MHWEYKLGVLKEICPTVYLRMKNAGIWRVEMPNVLVMEPVDGPKPAVGRGSSPEKCVLDLGKTLMESSKEGHVVVLLGKHEGAYRLTEHWKWAKLEEQLDVQVEVINITEVKDGEEAVPVGVEECAGDRQAEGANQEGAAEA